MSDDIQAMEVEEVPVEEIELKPVESSAEDVPEEKIEETAEQPKPEKTFTQADIDRAIEKRLGRERAKYERETEQLRQIALQRGEQKQEQVVQQQIEVAPTPDQYAGGEYDPEYIKALVDHRAKIATQQQLHQYAVMAEQERAQAAQRQTADNWNQKVSKATAELPDFDEVVGNLDLSQLPPHVGAFLADSDLGPQIAYHLMGHQDEAREIGSKNPVAAIRALTRIEDKLLAAKPVKKATDASAPITPVGSKAKSVKAPEDLPWEEFKAWRRKQIALRR